MSDSDTTQNCCVINLPGPPGPTITPTDGKDGFPAYTQLAVAFTMPAFGASDVASFVDAAWVALGEPIFVEGLGVLLVTNIAGTFITLLNLADATHYVQNSAPGTVAPATSLVTPSGWQGPDGSSVAGGAPANAPYVLSTPNVSLPLAQALSLIATGILKVTTGTGALSKASDGTDYLSPTTGLVPGDIGVSVQAYSAFLAAVAALGSVSDKITYGTGANTIALTPLTAFMRAVLGAADAATARLLLGVLPQYGLLGTISALDLNSATTDTAFTLSATRYRIDRVTVDKATVNMTTATLGLFTAAGGGGTTLAADQVLTALSATTKFKDLTLEAVAGTDALTAGTLYARCGTAQGVAATANLYLYGWRFA